jgi:hypothetical protein
MAHDHDHQHDTTTFYYEQIFTIIACALLALVTCLWWWRDFQGGQGLGLFIAKRYHLLVLGGGLGLFALVIVRAIAVWNSVDKPAAGDGHVHDDGPDHDHDHGHSHDHARAHDHAHECADGCGHEHGIVAADHHHEHAAAATHGHSHGHGHDHHDHDHAHGWAPWRYVVLLIPVFLFFLNLPNDGFAGKDISQGLNGPTDEVADKGFAPEIGFKELEQAALTPQTRDEMAGKTVKLVGKYTGDDPKRFSLSRFQMKCCSADAIPLNAVIMVDDTNGKEKLDPKKLRNKWVEVTGQVQFLNRPSAKDPSKLDYTPAVIIHPKPQKPLKEMVRVITTPPDQFLN